MERHLSLLKANTAYEEKRTFPRFLFSDMTFKAKGHAMAFQVSNISFTGMRIQLKDGIHHLKKDNQISGFIHWQRNKIQVQAQVVWANHQQLGLTFKDPQKIKELLSADRILQGLKPLHSFDEERPPHLKYWLKAASVLEVFVWAHGNGEYQKIQVLFVDHFIEWQDGQGLQTGTLLGEQAKDTPLNAQDERIIEMDHTIDWDKLASACDILQGIPEDKIQESAKEFMLMKFSTA